MARARKLEGKRGVSYQLIAYVGYDANGKQLTKTRTLKRHLSLVKGISAIDGKIRRQCP